MSDEFENICRICLRNVKSLQLLYETGWVNRTFAEILTEITRYTVSPLDKLPQKICEKCRKSAIDAFKFKLKCEQSYCQIVDQLQLSLESHGLQFESQKQVEKCTQTDESAFCMIEEKYISHDVFKTQQGSKSKEFSTSDVSCNQSEYVEANNQLESLCNICKYQCTDPDELLSHLALFHKSLEFSSSNILNGKHDSKKFLYLKENLNTFDTRNPYNDEMKEVSSLELVDLLKSGKENKDDEKPVAVFKNSDMSEQIFVENKIEQVFIDECNENSIFCTQKTSEENFTEKIINMGKDILNNHTQKEDLSFSCVMCSKFFKSPALLRKHMNNRHGFSKIIACTQCNKSFKTLPQYQKHIESKHTEKTHKCSICEKTFSTKIYLQRHIAVHEKKRYICKECSVSYTTKEELNTHVKAEGHDKPLLCPECGLRCKTSNILMVHMRRHKGEKPFKCKFCSKGFPRMDDLRIHEKYHTGEKSHFCETCGKGFQRKYNLTIHLRVHSGERPYKCPHCPQAFAQGNDLKAHIRRHTGERFRCEHCGAAFLQGYQMRQHKLSEHGIREEPPTQRVAKFTSTEAQELQIHQNLQSQSTQSLEEKTLEKNIKLGLNSLPVGINTIEEQLVGMSPPYL